MPALIDKWLDWLDSLPEIKSSWILACFVAIGLGYLMVATVVVFDLPAPVLLVQGTIGLIVSAKVVAFCLSLAQRPHF